MVKHLYPNFLADVGQYKASETYWISLWEESLRLSYTEFDWFYPWVSTGADDFLDGNPIFSAYSPSLKRGVRIIQFEPTEKKVEFFAYFDTVGGTVFDANAIRELVICCALSDVVASLASDRIRPWLAGDYVQLHGPNFDPVQMDFGSVSRALVRNPALTPAA